MNNESRRTIEVLRESIKEHNIIASNGIGENFFVFINMVSVVNIDCLLSVKQKEFCYRGKMMRIAVRGGISPETVFIFMKL